MVLQLRSLLQSNGELQLSLAEQPPAQPQADEVVVRVQATPINPSDLGLLLALADPASFAAAGTPEASDTKVPMKPVTAMTTPAAAGRKRALPYSLVSAKTKAMVKTITQAATYLMPHSTPPVTK